MANSVKKSSLNIEVKPLVSYTVKFLTGETNNFRTISEIITFLTQNLQTVKSRLKRAQDEVKDLPAKIELLETELKQFQDYKTENKVD